MYTLHDNVQEKMVDVVMLYWSSVSSSFPSVVEVSWSTGWLSIGKYCKHAGCNLIRK